MTDEREHSTPHRRLPFQDLSSPDRFARLFNRTALGAGILALGWLLLNAYWLRSGVLAVGLVAVMYLQRRLDIP